MLFKIVDRECSQHYHLSMMLKITTRSGAQYRVDEETLEVVRLAEHPVVDAVDDVTPMPAPCSMAGKLINDMAYMRVAEHVIFICDHCGTPVKSTRIVEEVELD